MSWLSNMLMTRQTELSAHAVLPVADLEDRLHSVVSDLERATLELRKTVRVVRGNDDGE